MISLIAWLPLWAQAGFLLAGLALGLIFLLMPFAVFGMKPRLEEVELQLGELRAELRSLSMRLPQGLPAQSASAQDSYRDEAGPTPSPDGRRPIAHTYGGTDPAQPPAAASSRAESRHTDFRDYADDPHAANPSGHPSVSQILRPTHFEPPPNRPEPARQPPRQARAAPWEDAVPPSSSAAAPLPAADAFPVDDVERLRRREEMSPRPSAEDERRRREDDRADLRHGGRGRAEPTLRWPPRG